MQPRSLQWGPLGQSPNAAHVTMDKAGCSALGAGQRADAVKKEMPSLGGSVPMHAVYMFSCKHSRTYDATAMAICMRRRARVRSVIRSSPSAANKPAATNCHRRSRRLPFPSPQSLRNKTKPKIYWGSTAATASDQKRMLARSGRACSHASQ